MRLAVYGPYSQEKENFVSRLSYLKQFEVIDSTSKNRFKTFFTGLELPIHTASYQLLVLSTSIILNLHKKDLETTYKECNFKGPLIVIIHGKKTSSINKMISDLQKEYDETKVNIIHAESLELIDLNIITDKLESLNSKNEFVMQ